MKMLALVFIAVNTAQAMNYWSSSEELETARSVEKCDSYWRPHIKEIDAALEKILERRKERQFNTDLKWSEGKLKSRLKSLNDALDYCYNSGLPKSKDKYSYLL